MTDELILTESEILDPKDPASTAVSIVQEGWDMVHEQANRSFDNTLELLDKMHDSLDGAIDELKLINAEDIEDVDFELTDHQLVVEQPTFTRTDTEGFELPDFETTDLDWDNVVFERTTPPTTVIEFERTDPDVSDPVFDRTPAEYTPPTFTRTPFTATDVALEHETPPHRDVTFSRSPVTVENPEFVRTPVDTGSVERPGLPSAPTGPTIPEITPDRGVSALTDYEDIPQEYLMFRRLGEMWSNWIDGLESALPTSVEQQIWDRDRDRISRTMSDQVTQEARRWAAMGWSLPGGEVIRRTRQIEDEARQKIAGQSREIAIRQADIVRENRKIAMEFGYKLCMELLQLRLDTAAKFYTLAVQIFEAAVAAYRAEAEVLIARYQADVQVLIGLAEIVWKYFNGDIELFKARVLAASNRADVIVKFFHEDIQKYLADIQGESARDDVFAKYRGMDIETYQADLQKMLGIADVVVKYYGADIERYRAAIQDASTQADTIIKTYATDVSKYQADTGAVVGVAEVVEKYYEGDINKYQADVQSAVGLADVVVKYFAGDIDKYKAEVQAAVGKADAIARLFSADVAKYGAEIDGLAKKSEAITEFFKADVAKYEAEGQVAGDIAKAITEFYRQDVEKFKAKVEAAIANVKMKVEAGGYNLQATAKRIDAGIGFYGTAAHVSTGLTSSLWSAVNLAAGISGTGSESSSTSGSVSYNHVIPHAERDI